MVPWIITTVVLCINAAILACHFVLRRQVTRDLRRKEAVLAEMQRLVGVIEEETRIRYVRRDA